MDFEIKHELAASAQATWNLVFSEDFEQLLDSKQPEVQREVLSTETIGGITTRTTHIRIAKALPSIVAKVIGSEGLSYTLEERTEPGALRMTWKVTPDRLGDRLDASGDYLIVDQGGSCTRIIRGCVRAKIPVVGGKIEKFIAGELEASYDRGATLIARLLQEGLS